MSLLYPVDFKKISGQILNKYEVARLEWEIPVRELFKHLDLLAPREADPAGEQHRGSGVITGAVFVVAHQRESPAGELHTDLMAAPGVQPDVNKALFAGTKALILQPCEFYALSLFFDHKNLIFPTVFK